MTRSDIIYPIDSATLIDADATNSAPFWYLIDADANTHPIGSRITVQDIHDGYQCDAYIVGWDGKTGQEIAQIIPDDLQDIPPAERVCRGHLRATLPVMPGRDLAADIWCELATYTEPAWWVRPYISGHLQPGTKTLDLNELQGDA